MAEFLHCRRAEFDVEIRTERAHEIRAMNDADELIAMQHRQAFDPAVFHQSRNLDKGGALLYSTKLGGHDLFDGLITHACEPVGAPAKDEAAAVKRSIVLTAMGAAQKITSRQHAEHRS